MAKVGAKKVGGWVLGEVLGSGSYAEVKHCVHAETRRQAAAKVVPKHRVAKGSGRKLLEREIATMKKLDHPSVLCLYDALETTDNIYLILEFAGGGELFDLIQDHKRFTEEVARSYFQQLVLGLRYCHRQGIVHRDLKPQNLLLTSEGRLKIADFGFANMQTVGEDGRVQSVFRMHTQCGTPNYAAPEVFLGDGYDGFLTDIWSCGVIFYVMLCGHVPFQPLPGVAGLRGIIMAIVEGRYSVPPEISPLATDLITNILVTTPEFRMKISDIVKHPWFTGGEEAGGDEDDDDAPTEITESDVETSIIFVNEVVHEMAPEPAPLSAEEQPADSGPGGLVDALAPTASPSLPAPRAGYSGAASFSDPKVQLAPDVQSLLHHQPLFQVDHLGRASRPTPERMGGAAAAVRLAVAKTPEQRAAAQLKAGHFTKHRFVRRRWNMPRWCFLCTRFIYGIGRQGFECEECGCPVHVECHEEANNVTCCEHFRAAGSPERIATPGQRRRRNTALQQQKPQIAQQDPSPGGLLAAPNSVPRSPPTSSPAQPSVRPPTLLAVPVPDGQKSLLSSVPVAEGTPSLLAVPLAGTLRGTALPTPGKTTPPKSRQCSAAAPSLLSTSPPLVPPRLGAPELL
eukprot:Hpha_TRINITY_DN16462_c0_g1::TRINITY_DN16462_c0_g1_i1::g.161896::m.161896